MHACMHVCIRSRYFFVLVDGGCLSVCMLFSSVYDCVCVCVCAGTCTHMPAHVCGCVCEREKQNLSVGERER